PRTEERWEDALEDRIFSLAVSAPPTDVRTGSRSEIERYLDEAIEGALRPALERAGRWSIRGRIEIANGQPGLQVEIDGRTVGALEGDVTELVDVKPGAHKVVL